MPCFDDVRASSLDLDSEEEVEEEVFAPGTKATIRMSSPINTGEGAAVGGSRMSAALIKPIPDADDDSGKVLGVPEEIDEGDDTRNGG